MGHSNPPPPPRPSPLWKRKFRHPSFLVVGTFEVCIQRIQNFVGFEKNIPTSPVSEVAFHRAGLGWSDFFGMSQSHTCDLEKVGKSVLLNLVTEIRKILLTKYR